jgi:tetratricopeptide (TPR) repeat protein
MSAHFQRALLLFQQSRADLAENELRQELLVSPNDPLAHALLGLCLAERHAYDEATEHARTAIGEAPDMAFAHYALGRVLEDRNRLGEAAASALEAIRLDPEEPDYYALLASVRLQERRWNDAVAAAEQGLRTDPEHAGCVNLKAMAMVKSGRRAEAGAVIESALARDPQNAFTHANQGWALLHAGDHARALEHFREALRIDPELEFARAGIVEALKAKHLVYSVMLKYFLWMSGLSRKAQWGVIIGIYLLFRVLQGIAKADSSLAPFVLPVLVLGVVFALMTWIAQPLFNLLLRLNRFGRLALSREQVVASNWVGGCVLATILTIVAAVVTKHGVAILAAVVSWLLIFPVAGTFSCAHGWPRKVMATYTALLAAAGVGGLALLAAEYPVDVVPRTGTEPGVALLVLFVLGAFLAPWIANALGHVRPWR